MKLKLLRLIPTINEKFLHAHIDLEILDLNIQLKGVKLTMKGAFILVHMPSLLTERGVKYTPMNFLKDEDYHAFKKSVLETINEVYPLAQWGKGIYDINSLLKKPQ